MIADVAANTLTLVFRAFLAEQGMEHLSTALRKAGIRDLLLFFPANKRDNKTLDEHFRKHGIPQVAEWWVKKQYAIAKESIVTLLKDLIEKEESHADVCLPVNHSMCMIMMMISFL